MVSGGGDKYIVTTHRHSVVSPGCPSAVALLIFLTGTIVYAIIYVPMAGTTTLWNRCTARSWLFGKCGRASLPDGRLSVPNNQERLTIVFGDVLGEFAHMKTTSSCGSRHTKIETMIQKHRATYIFSVCCAMKLPHAPSLARKPWFFKQKTTMASSKKKS